MVDVINETDADLRMRLEPLKRKMQQSEDKVDGDNLRDLIVQTGDVLLPLYNKTKPRFWHWFKWRRERSIKAKLYSSKLKTLSFYAKVWEVIYDDKEYRKGD